MIVYITNLSALEQSDGNRRLRAIIDEIVVAQTATTNPDSMISNVLKRVQQEGHSFVIMSNGNRQSATEDEIRSKIYEYVQTALAASQEPQRREEEEEQVEEGDAPEEGEADDSSFDWLAGVGSLDEFEEMVLNDEVSLMDSGIVDVVDPFPIEDEVVGDGNDFLEGDLDVLGAFLDEPPMDDELLLHD